jgi:hypothetical protein
MATNATNPASAAAPTGFGDIDLRLGERSSEDNRTKTNLQAPPSAAVAGAIGGALLIDSIKIDHRFRREMGDVAALARSIEAIGLLHPITVDQDGKLLAGARRLAAFKILKRETIPVTVVQVPKWS